MLLPRQRLRLYQQCEAMHTVVLLITHQVLSVVRYIGSAPEALR